MIGCDGHSDSKHVFKFAAFLYENGDEDGFTIHDTIEEAVKDYKDALKLIKHSKQEFQQNSFEERDFIHKQGCIVNEKKCDKGKHYECWKCPFATCNISFEVKENKM